MCQFYKSKRETYTEVEHFLKQMFFLFFFTTKSIPYILKGTSLLTRKNTQSLFC